MKLSKNFTSEEFQCRCCGKITIEPKLIEVLQTLRDHLGPIHITSGYRCEYHNKDVGGIKNSYHTRGMAADFKVEGRTPSEVLQYIETNLPEISNSCGIGIYRSWTHIDVRGTKARWDNRNV